ncbi:MAG: preprotein translocase subunit SecE [Gemmatimonadaceae bacterium]
MSNEVVAPAPSLPSRVVTFYHDVVAEMKKVTWPDRGQIQSLSIGVIVLSLLVGAVIWVLDLVLQGVLVRLVPSLFGA